jgi:hypothetical protein
MVVYLHSFFKLLHKIWSNFLLKKQHLHSLAELGWGLRLLYIQLKSVFWMRPTYLQGKSLCVTQNGSKIVI